MLAVLASDHVSAGLMNAKLVVNGRGYNRHMDLLSNLHEMAFCYDAGGVFVGVADFQPKAMGEVMSVVDFNKHLCAWEWL